MIEYKQILNKLSFQKKKINKETIKKFENSYQTILLSRFFAFL